MNSLAQPATNEKETHTSQSQPDWHRECDLLQCNFPQIMSHCAMVIEYRLLGQLNEDIVTSHEVSVGSSTLIELWTYRRPLLRIAFSKLIHSVAIGILLMQTEDMSQKTMTRDGFPASSCWWKYLMNQVSRMATSHVARALSTFAL